MLLLLEEHSESVLTFIHSSNASLLSDPESKAALKQADLEKGHPVSCKAKRLKRFTRCWGRLLALKIFESKCLQELSQVEEQHWKTDIKKPKMKRIYNSLLHVFSLSENKTSHSWNLGREIWSQMYLLQSKERSDKVDNQKKRTLFTERSFRRNTPNVS